MKRIKAKTARLNLTGALLLAGFALYVVLFFFPIIWSVYTSFKTPHNFVEDPLWLPQKWVVSNYVTVFKEFAFTTTVNGQRYYILLTEMYMNSALYSLGAAFINTACCCLVAYLTAVFDWKFSKIIYQTVIVIMILPVVGTLPAALGLMRGLGLYDSLVGIYISSFSFLGMGYLIFYATFKQLPKSFIEAAKIDGATNLRVMLQVMLPMAASAFSTLFLMNFVGRWNDYQTSLLWLPSRPTVAYGVFAFSFNQVGTIANVPMKLTGSMLLLLPVLIVFLAFHKRLLVNMTMGGLKE
ncbi:MAG: carbohydrate ABC transporter permease [Clostridiales bacterium]|jgi:ABC-type glycerol-3-phosphate transport system permease component|nr:carbohydrate ABC transporter permease [Clostridiales bacterium]